MYVMRKNLLMLLCCMLAGGSCLFSNDLCAQTIPNGDFSAEWEAGCNGAGTQPAFWKASNVNQMGLKKELVTRNSDGSVLLTNTYVGMFGIGSNAPAYITLGTPWVYTVLDVSKCDGGTSGGIEFSTRPDSIVGVFKRRVASPESARLVMYLWKGTVLSFTPDNKELIDNERDVLAENGSVELIGLVDYEITGELSDWTRISVPVKYFSDALPEKMNVTLSSADYRNRSKIQENNTLTVQRVELIYDDPVSSEKVQLPSGRIYVADRVLYLDDSYSSLTVYAMNGRLVYRISQPGYSVSLAVLPTGVYTVKVEGAQGVQTEKILIR